MKKGDNLRYKITQNGAPIINQGYVREIGENIVALQIDLKSKYCEVDFSFGGSDEVCGVYVSANETSIHLNGKVKRDEPTGIEFTDFSGWDVFSCGINRYTLNVCLIRTKIEGVK